MKKTSIKEFNGGLIKRYKSEKTDLIIALCSDNSLYLAHKNDCIFIEKEEALIISNFLKKYALTGKI